MAAQDGGAEDFGVVLAQIFVAGDHEAGGTAGGIAEDIGWHGRDQGDHHLDDMARGAELAVLSGAGELAKHVLVEVALGVAVLQGNLVQHIHHAGQQARFFGREGEAGVFHMSAESGLFTTQRLGKRENFNFNDAVQL